MLNHASERLSPGLLIKKLFVRKESTVDEANYQALISTG